MEEYVTENKGVALMQEIAQYVFQDKYIKCISKIKREQEKN